MYLRFCSGEKKKKNMLRNTFCSDKHLYFLAKKNHPRLLQYGTFFFFFFVTIPPFLHYCPLFVTVCYSFALFVLYSLFRSVQTPVWAIVYCMENFRKTRKILYCNATFSYGTLIKQQSGLSRNYRLRQLPRGNLMFLKQIFALRTSNFQGASIRPIVPRHIQSIVFNLLFTTKFSSSRQFKTHIELFSIYMDESRESQI